MTIEFETIYILTQFVFTSIDLKPMLDLEEENVDMVHEVINEELKKTPKFLICDVKQMYRLRKSAKHLSDITSVFGDSFNLTTIIIIEWVL